MPSIDKSGRYIDIRTGREVRNTEILLCMQEWRLQGHKIIIGDVVPYTVSSIVTLWDVPMRILRQTSKEEYLKENDGVYPPEKDAYFYEVEAAD